MESLIVLVYFVLDEDKQQATYVGCQRFPDVDCDQFRSLLCVLIAFC